MYRSTVSSLGLHLLAFTIAYNGLPEIKKNLRSINQLIMKLPNKYILITGSLYLIGKIRKTYL